LIINYDGFNEIGGPFAQNYDRGINAIYPITFDQSVYATASDGECNALNNWLLSALNRAKMIWANSSNKIYQFAKAKNIPYIHIVQPNQYLENSKPLSKIEAEKYNDSPDFKASISNYYHTLSMRIESLVGQALEENRY